MSNLLRCRDDSHRQTPTPHSKSYKISVATIFTFTIVSLTISELAGWSWGDREGNDRSDRGRRASEETAEALREQGKQLNDDLEDVADETPALSRYLQTGALYPRHSRRSSAWRSTS